MARPKKELPSRSAIVPAVMRHARALGLDVDALAWRFALPEGAADREEVRAAAGAADELMQVVAQGSGEDDVALRVARAVENRPLKLADLLVRSSATVRDGAEAVAGATCLLQEGLEASVDSIDGGIRWVLRTPRRPRGLGRHVHELALAHAVVRLRQAAPGVEVAGVFFAHPRPARTEALVAFFGTADVAFGGEQSGFVLPRATVDLPMVGADARTVETIAPLVDAEIRARPQAPAFADRVAAHVRDALPGGADVAEVAQALHMSARTLQRRLEDEETRFGEVLDRARLERARELLTDPDVSLIDVAFRLGFSDLATFSRAFKRWTGMPPGQWRRS